MTDDQNLTDTEVHELLVAAFQVLGSKPGETVAGNTAIAAARKALALLQIGLVASAERRKGEDAPYGKPKRPKRPPRL